jgi:hypothetical protein
MQPDRRNGIEMLEGRLRNTIATKQLDTTTALCALLTAPLIPPSKARLKAANGGRRLNGGAACGCSSLLREGRFGGCRRRGGDGAIEVLKKWRRGCTPRAEQQRLRASRFSLARRGLARRDSRV